jgi:signal transduction histidine kinase
MSPSIDTLRHGAPDSSPDADVRANSLAAADAKELLREMLVACPRPDSLVAALLDADDSGTAWLARSPHFDASVREHLMAAGFGAASRARGIDLPVGCDLESVAEISVLRAAGGRSLVLVQSRRRPENEHFLRGALSLLDCSLALPELQGRVQRLQARLAQIRAGLRAGVQAKRAFQDLEGAADWLVDLRERFSAEAVALILEDGEAGSTLLSDARTTTSLQHDFLAACLRSYRREGGVHLPERMRWWNLADGVHEKLELEDLEGASAEPWPSVAEVTSTTGQGQKLWVYLASRLPRAFAPESIEMLRSSVAAHARNFAQALDRERRERERLQRLLRELPAGVLVVEPDGSLGAINAEALELLGCSTEPHDLTGLSEVTGVDLRTLHAEFRAQTPEENLPRRIDLVAPARTLLVEARSVEHEGGRPPAWLWTLRDVSAEQRRERARSEFVSTVGHELKTPLTSLQTALELLHSEELGPLSEEQVRFVDLGLRASSRLARRVQQLLEVARDETGRLQLVRERCDLVAVLADPLRELKMKAEREERDYRVEHPDHAEAFADAERVGEIVENLVGNAFKFCPPASPVRLVMRREMPCPRSQDLDLARAAGVSAEGVEIEVRDAGRGMSPATLQHAFDPFYQEGDPLSDRPEGVGLGLSIVRSLVQAHDGEIRVDSRPGGGTSVRVWLPHRREMADLRSARQRLEIRLDSARSSRQRLELRLVAGGEEGEPGWDWESLEIDTDASAAGVVFPDDGRSAGTLLAELCRRRARGLGPSADPPVRKGPK